MARIAGRVARVNDIDGMPMKMLVIAVRDGDIDREIYETSMAEVVVGTDVEVDTESGRVYAVNGKDLSYRPRPVMITGTVSATTTDGLITLDVDDRRPLG